MSSVGKKAVSEAEFALAQAGVDADLVQALLAAYRQLSVSEQVRALLAAAFDWTGAEFGVGYATQQGRRSLIPVVSSSHDEDPRFLTFTALSPGRVSGLVADGPQVFCGFGPFAALTPDWPDDPPELCVALPVVSSRGRWAGLALLLVRGEEPDPEVVQRLGRLLELTRPAVDNALKVLSMRDLVIKDDTAHCFNRRHFEEFLPEELARASRFRSPVSLIFLDMDNLKEVNSRHGHAMGSRTLYEVSVRVRAKIRKFDKLFRFGGDEFCIVLPETEWHGALEVAERVRDAIASKPFLAREVNDGKGVDMSASLGIASFPLHARTQAALIQHADRAMQKIKRTTKNAIGISEIEEQDDQ